MYGYFHDAELYELGIVMYRAFNNPKELKKLDPKVRAVEQMVENLDMGGLPAMLRIPKKKTKVEDGG